MLPHPAESSVNCTRGPKRNTSPHTRGGSCTSFGRGACRKRGAAPRW